jgi:hypothetical protein
MFDVGCSRFASLSQATSASLFQPARGGYHSAPNFDVQRSAFNVRCSPFPIPRRARSCRIVPGRAQFMQTTLPNHMKPPLDGTPVINLFSPARWTAETQARPNIFSDLMRLTERFVL